MRHFENCCALFLVASSYEGRPSHASGEGNPIRQPIKRVARAAGRILVAASLEEQIFHEGGHDERQHDDADEAEKPHAPHHPAAGYVLHHLFIPLRRRLPPGAAVRDASVRVIRIRRL